MRALLIPLLTAGLFAFPAAAQDTPQPSLTVSATGEATRVPDLANVSLQIVRTGKTAREALDANTQAMAAVLAAMREAGVEERDLQTASFSISPQYFHARHDNNSNEPPKPPTITGYTVSNDLSVRIRDIAKVGTVLDRAVTLGVNSGGNIAFGSSKAEEAEDEARANAVKRALAKAKTLTDAAGITLGKVLSIQETQRGAPRMAQMRMAEASMDAAVPIAAGEQSATVSVTIRFEIVQ